MYHKPVKIIATTGPSSDSYEMVRDLAKAGVNVFRVNLSHATREEIDNRFSWIRQAEQELGIPLTIMGDLAGPKIRIEEIAEGAILEKGQKVTVCTDHIIGDGKKFSLNYPSIIEMIEPGATIYVDDGAIKLRAEKKVIRGIEAIVTVGGPLLSRKGFLAEGIALSKTGVSEKDKASIQLMVEKGADALAISFVQTANDVQEIKNLLPTDSNIFLVAKIETAGGIENAEAILDVVDVMMIARGDMGLAVPMAKVPHIQKELIKLCLRKAKPVITATQMLESMVSRSIPTRAEVTDVANAILDGTDCVMLSAETARGEFPIETVEMMVKIIHETATHMETYEYKEKHTTGNTISDEVGRVADQIGTKVIIAYTQTGDTARRIARHRHHQQTIIALSPNPHVIRHLNFTWGVFPRQISGTTDFDHMTAQAHDLAENNPILPLVKDDLYIISAGMPYGASGTTNMILVQKV